MLVQAFLAQPRIEALDVRVLDRLAQLDELQLKDQLMTGEVLNFYKFPLQIVKRVKEPFDGDGWLFEIKHDGFRVLAVRDGGANSAFQ